MSFTNHEEHDYGHKYFRIFNILALIVCYVVYFKEVGAELKVIV